VYLKITFERVYATSSYMLRYQIHISLANVGNITMTGRKVQKRIRHFSEKYL